jgi:N-acetyl-1-D-myo-inositol-2-amino-2-deoxy-alpha-D-glucopyranoside deacetylase
MVTAAPTLVCVHAHPDDEALFTAGITSHYGDLGYRVVLITCTNGQLGLDDRGRPGSDPLHNVEVTRATRAAELQRAAIVAGYSSGRDAGIRRLRHAGLGAERFP